MKNFKPLTLCCLISFFVLAAPCARALTIEGENSFYSLTLPDGWEENLWFQYLTDIASKHNMLPLPSTQKRVTSAAEKMSVSVLLIELNNEGDTQLSPEQQIEIFMDSYNIKLLHIPANTPVYVDDSVRGRFRLVDGSTQIVHMYILKKHFLTLTGQVYDSALSENADKLDALMGAIVIAPQHKLPAPESSAPAPAPAPVPANTMSGKQT